MGFLTALNARIDSAQPALCPPIVGLANAACQPSWLAVRAREGNPPCRDQTRIDRRRKGWPSFHRDPGNAGVLNNRTAGLYVSHSCDVPAVNARAQGTGGATSTAHLRRCPDLVSDPGPVRSSQVRKSSTSGSARKFDRQDNATPPLAQSFPASSVRGIAGRQPAPKQC